MCHHKVSPRQNFALNGACVIYMCAYVYVCIYVCGLHVMYLAYTYMYRGVCIDLITLSQLISLQESYADHLSSLLTVLLNIILEHYSELMEECLLIESLAIIKSLLNLLHNQSLQKQSVSRSNSVIPNSNRDSSSSPDNTSSKELEQVTNGVGGANCDYTNIVGLANVVETYLLLFPKLIFDACKVKHFDQSYTKEWEGSREAIECCQSSCDLLVDFLSLPLSGMLVMLILKLVLYIYILQI